MACLFAAGSCASLEAVLHTCLHLACAGSVSPIVGKAQGKEAAYRFSRGVPLAMREGNSLLDSPGGYDGEHKKPLTHLKNRSDFDYKASVIGSRGFG